MAGLREPPRRQVEVTLLSGQVERGNQGISSLNLGLSLGIQVCKYYLLWGLKYPNITYFGLFGSPGYVDVQFSGWGYVDVQFTQRLQCSSFLVMTYFLLRDYNILPEKELHSSLWVVAFTPELEGMTS